MIKTATAAGLLPEMLERFRAGNTEPLFFGDAGQPEGVMIPFELWRRLDALATDEDGFDATYDVARDRLQNPAPSIQFDADVAAEFGIDLSKPVDDSDLPKPQ
ncbi:hypothetical protein ACWGID_32615 [Kribbella sp. NPDC054772]